MRDKVKIVGPWLLGEVLAPLGVPVVFALVIILLSWTLEPDTGAWQVLGKVLRDNVSPWVLTVYALTLIGSTFNDLRARMNQHWPLAVWLGIVAAVVAVYAGLIAEQQYKSSEWSPNGYTWAVSAIMLLIAVALSGWGHYLGKRP